ncbi:MAG TPA: biotin synthase BioB [Fibrobacteria bacterium]|nr:biotin synthase BioB [Fibrobacteria bacterium]HOX50136.1 biotin synthase BioB [Fibrobacteria bacterium]
MDTANACFGAHPKSIPRLESVTRRQVLDLFDLPLPDLLVRAQAAHREHFDAREIRASTLVSIKTGACTEDCSYCAQSSHHATPVPYRPLMSVSEVLEAGRKAKAAGATRLCMGAAWRSPRTGPQFDAILEMVRGVKAMGLEACMTLGMLDDDQARHLKEAGLDYYNHNLDTSPEYYSRIITTRTFQDRLDTIRRVQEAGIRVCSGGILGMGESREDRAGLLHELANLTVPPESVPINKLMPMAGTPLSDAAPLDDLEIVRAIAVTRILLPATQIRLSAGRSSMSNALQLLCFVAGANGIFLGDQLLTAENPSQNEDKAMIESFGMVLRTDN